MTAMANSDTQLVTEHFGYPPVSLLDDIINSINILAERALNSVEQGLLNAPPEQIGFRNPKKSKRDNKNKDASSSSKEAIEEKARNEIETGTHQLETLLCASIDRNFDKFELYVLRNILCVRPEDRDWIRLSHYDGLNFENLSPRNNDKNNNNNNTTNGSSANSDRPSLELVNRLRRRLQASQKLNCMLHAEKARNDALLGELRTLVGSARDRAAASRNSLSNSVSCASTPIKDEPEKGGPSPFAFLYNKGDLTDGDAETPLTTTTAFSLSQLQALRALSTSLQNVMPDLKGHGAVAGENGGDSSSAAEGRRSWRKERVEYVELAVRKHLENVRGLELGENGEVRDGEWQGEGRRLAKGEVEGLEKVVSALASGTENKADGDEMDES